jgi:acyl-CoA thioester hydrolase
MPKTVCPLTGSGRAWYGEGMFSTRIYYQDTDAGGVVYFGNYLRFLEKAWFEYLMSIGISLPEWQKDDIYIMVKEVSLDLVDKVKYAEIIRIEVTVKEVKNSSFILNYEILKDDKLVTRAETKIVCVDGRGKLKRMPGPFKERLLAGAGQT